VSGNPLVNKWKGFLSTLKTDPNMRMALIQTGIGMMRSPRMGENGWDVAGEALGRGVMTLDQLRQRDKEGREKEEKERFQREQEAARTGAYVEGTQAQVGESKARVKTAQEKAQREADEFEYEKTQRERAEKLVDEQIRSEHALASQRMASAQRERALAANVGKEGGTGGGSRRPTNLEYAVEILMDDYVSQGFTEEQARVKALREYNSKKTSVFEELNKYKSTAAEIAGIDLLKMTPEEKVAWEQKVENDFYELKKREMEINQQQGVVDRRQQATHVGRFVPVTAGGKQAQAEVVGLQGGRVILRLPDGTTKAVSVGQFEQTYGPAQ